jgi:hypothetical protein
VSHRSLIRFLGFVILRDYKGVNIFVLTDYYSNESVDAYCKTNSPSNTDKMIWIFGIAVGMTYLHSWRIQHRDLKPGNVFLDATLHPRIGDLGSSKDFSMMDSFKQSGQVGTAHYTAPEIWDDGDGSWEVDVYAYGMTVYEIVTGEIPFAQLQRPAAIIRRVSNGERPPLPSSISPNLQSLITSSWDQDPSKRLRFPAILRFLIESGPLLPDVDNPKYQAYIQEFRRSTLRFNYDNRTIECDFNFLDGVADVRRWASRTFQLRYVDLEYDGIILNDSDTFLVMSFDPKIPIVVRYRSSRYTSETDGQMTDEMTIEVRLPLGNLVEMKVSLKADVQCVQDHLVRDFGLPELQGDRNLIMLGSDLKRLAPNERVRGLQLPLTAAKPVAILSLQKRTQPSDVIAFPCLQADTVDHLKDFLAQKLPTADSRAIVLLDGSEPPGSRNLMSLSHPKCHWEFDLVNVTRSRSALSFNVAFDQMHPFDGGIIRRLRELEVRFDPLVVITQSANNVSSIINPNINDVGYVSLGRGGAVIELFSQTKLD